MKRRVKARSWVAALLVVMSACTAPNATERTEIESLKQKLPALEANRALMQITVGDQDFYPRNLPFKTKVQVLPQSFKASFMDSTFSNVEMEMIKNDWFDRKPIAFTLRNGVAGETGGDQVMIMMGKLLDQVNLQGEGYLLVNGEIKIPELSKKLISVTFEGNLVKPGQASVVENYVPVKGSILIKEPDFTESSDELLKRIE